MSHPRASLSSTAQVTSPSRIAIGVFPNYAVQAKTTLVCREKMFSLSGDDFDIKDSNGVTVCHVEGKALTMHDTKNFKDLHGNLLFTLKKNTFSMRGSHTANKADGSLAFEVQGHFKMLGSKMTAKFINTADGKELNIECKGDWLSKSCEMILVQTGQKVATISRNLMSMRDWFGDKQTYFVTVEPGVDLVLMAALAITFDEKNNDQNK